MNTSASGRTPRALQQPRGETLPFEGVVCHSEGLYRVYEIDWDSHWLETQRPSAASNSAGQVEFTSRFRLGSTNEIVEEENNNEQTESHQRRLHMIAEDLNER